MTMKYLFKSDKGQHNFIQQGITVMFPQILDCPQGQ